MPADEAPDLTRPSLFAQWTRDRARYGDTDRQGHVNNAVFATFLETGRVSILYDPKRPLAPEGTAFVIARLLLEFRSEIRWADEVAIGTVVTRLGSSSFTLGQGLFVGSACVATAETVIVLMNEETRRSNALPPQTRDALRSYVGACPLPDWLSRPLAGDGTHGGD